MEKYIQTCNQVVVMPTDKTETIIAAVTTPKSRVFLSLSLSLGLGLGTGLHTILHIYIYDT